MTRILQCLVWISVMTATRSQGAFYGYRQNQRSISFPDTRTHENYYHTRHSVNLASEYQDPRRQRIQNRLTDQRRTENGYRIQVNKRGGHRPHYIIYSSISRLLLELMAALGALPDSSEVVFPGPSTKSRYAPEISEECRKRGYCEEIPNYPKEQVQLLISKSGEDLKLRIVSDELDTDVQVAQRFGSEGPTFGLCNADPERLLIPDSLPDRNNVWWTVLQDRDNNMTQGFRAETCRESARDKPCSDLVTFPPGYSNKCVQKARDKPCSDLVTFPPGYSNKCVQKYVYRSVLIVDNNKAIAQKSLRLPSCCSCVITAPGL